MSLKSIRAYSGLLLFAAGSALTAEKTEDLKVDMALPICLSWVPPVYPKEAADKKLEGQAQVRFIIDETGAVTTARAVHSTNKIFDEAAVRAVRQWRFEPAMEEGRKVSKSMDVMVPFERADLKRRPETAVPPARIVQTLTYSPYIRAKKEKGDDPDYPDSLLPRHLPGEVDLEFTVTREGRAQGIKILWATHADFIRPALAAVDRWTFRPAQQGDLTMEATLQAALEFDVLDAKRLDLLSACGITLVDPAGETYDRKPQQKIVVDPVYPYDLRLAGVAGEAEVDFTIAPNGQAETIAVRAATQPAFGRALGAAVDCWLFIPAAKNGAPVAIKATARWHYILAPDSPVFESTERLVQRLRGGDTAGMGAKGLDAQLRPVHQFPPIYPAALLGEKPTGEATITFIIDYDGRCRLARIDSATREEFGWAAATAIERWVFDPPKRNGEPADVRVSIPVRFSPPP